MTMVKTSEEWVEKIITTAPMDTPTPFAELLKIEGINFSGSMNVSDDVVLAHMAHSCRLGYPQAFPQPKKADRVVLVGSGPSLNKTEKELVKLVHEGAKLVTTNGAYQWCLERNLLPKAQIVLDARETNARFLEPEAPDCIYMLASQCHPKTWEMVKDRPRVLIWHSVGDKDSARAEFLNQFYLKQWAGISGGTTVITRAIGLLRTCGYLRFDLFGVDSCWDGEIGHAFPQPENDRDRRLLFKVAPEGEPEKARTFICSPWHLKQFEDFLQFIAAAGDHFALRVHGDGLIAFGIESQSGGLDLTITEEENK